MVRGVNTAHQAQNEKEMVSLMEVFKNLELQVMLLAKVLHYVLPQHRYLRSFHRADGLRGGTASYISHINRKVVNKNIPTPNKESVHSQACCWTADLVEMRCNSLTVSRMIRSYLSFVNLQCEQFDLCPVMPSATEIQSFTTQRGFGFSPLFTTSL